MEILSRISASGGADFAQRGGLLLGKPRPCPEFKRAWKQPHDADEEARPDHASEGRSWQAHLGAAPVRRQRIYHDPTSQLKSGMKDWHTY
jgi:hypothetical protein